MHNPLHIAPKSSALLLFACMCLPAACGCSFRPVTADDQHKHPESVLLERIDMGIVENGASVARIVRLPCKAQPAGFRASCDCLSLKRLAVSATPTDEQLIEFAIDFSKSKEYSGSLAISVEIMDDSGALLLKREVNVEVLDSNVIQGASQLRSL